MKNIAKVVALLLAVVLCVGATSGCKNKNPQGRKAVQGAVKLDGTPIADGAIDFQPEDSNNPQTSAGAKIVDGVYLIPAEKGLVDGTYKVAVSARVDTGETKETAMGTQAVFEETIPPAYGEETEQTTTVSGKGPIVYDADIPSK